MISGTTPASIPSKPTASVLPRQRLEYNEEINDSRNTVAAQLDLSDPFARGWDRKTRTRGVASGRQPDDRTEEAVGSPPLEVSSKILSFVRQRRRTSREE